MSQNLGWRYSSIGILPAQHFLLQLSPTPQPCIVHMIIILALQRQKQESQKFKATLGYIEYLKPAWIVSKLQKFKFWKGQSAISHLFYLSSLSTHPPTHFPFPSLLSSLCPSPSFPGLFTWKTTTPPRSYCSSREVLVNGILIWTARTASHSDSQTSMYDSPNLSQRVPSPLPPNLLS